ncbi:SDR family NAD(P)-dependent oxidoreductase [Cupriavidus pauculus]|uniref:SDR family NAD(P)-dependent oxidoreductase n=1 Tax=Cupriavidus pauculus TaxID=82633 RepID=UPI0015DF9500|nr:SDR family oxidoreductase [Cupriavidus pauculus]
MSQRIAVVTGGGTGIGRAIAELFAADGLRVVCLGMDADGDLPSTLEFRRGDVTDAAAMRDATADLDAVSVLVNAAGIILHERKEFTPEGFRKVVDVNLNGSQCLISVLEQRLVAARGAVVNVASMWSYFGSPNNPAYTASKAGVLGLTRAYAVALAPQGVRVNAVAPGWIRTRLSAGALDNPERSAAIMARIPMQRWGTTHDVARVVRLLCTEDTAYVTGVIVPVDGGFGIA